MVKKVIEDVIKLLNVEIEEVSVNRDNTERVVFMVKTNESGLLIGTRGGSLHALNVLVKNMVARKVATEEIPLFFIDVNNYQEKLEEEIKTKASIMAQRARSFEVDVPLPPMTSYERMMVHNFLKDFADIKTESEGEGRERRVVIRYIKDSIEEKVVEDLEYKE